jgi:hypothetical protein
MYKAKMHLSEISDTAKTVRASPSLNSLGCCLSISLACSPAYGLTGRYSDHESQISSLCTYFAVGSSGVNRTASETR